MAKGSRRASRQRIGRSRNRASLAANALNNGASEKQGLGVALARNPVGNGLEIIEKPAAGTIQKIHYLTGGDGSLFAMYVIDQNNQGKMYYIYTDHLGSPNLITDAECNVVQELSYDAWGNRRDPANWQPYTSLASIPSSLIDRGFTFHEHLYPFTLINMNGRAYDPLVGRFLSADPYIQAPDNPQNLNRYSYCLNNPLRYTDPSGEIIIIDDAIAAVVGGVINWASNGCRFDAKGLGFFAVGAVAGALATYGPVGWTAGGAITGGANAALNGAKGWDILSGAAIGAASGLAGGAAGQWAGKSLGGLLVNGYNVTSPVVKGAITGSIGGGAAGYVGGFTAGFLATGDIQQAASSGLEGMKFGFALGAATGAISAYKSAKAHKIDPWSGKRLTEESIVIGRNMENRVNPAAKDLGAETISEPWNKHFGENTSPKFQDGLDFNNKWLIEKLMKNVRIYDIGPGGRPIEGNYLMELNTIRQYEYQHVNKTLYWNYSDKFRVILIR